MDSFKFRDVKVEKANAISKHQSIKKITTLFRLLELFVFIIILSRFTTQFSFPFNLSGEYFKGISVTLISPRFVFLAGNAIVVVLLLISGQFSSSVEKSVDFYDEYVDKCRNNDHLRFSIEEQKAACEHEHVRKKKAMMNMSKEEQKPPCEHEHVRKKKTMMNMSRCKSERNMERVARGKDLRRSVSERGRKREEEMSGEEFRRTVEAFIARQQRFLREEEEEGFSALVNV